MTAHLSPRNRPLNLVYCSFASGLEVRADLPIRALRMRGANIRTFRNEIGFMPTVPDNAPKILLVQRSLNNPDVWPEIMRYAIARDWLVVAERDDYPVTPVKSSEAKWNTSMKWDIFSACHAVQTSTESLRTLFLAYNPEVAVFPNQMGEVPLYRFRDDGKIRLFFGAYNRGGAWRPLLAAINRVIEKYPHIVPVVIHDREFHDAIQAPVREFHDRCSYSDYLQHLASCDVALLPLEDNVFTRHKSDVKFVEAGGARTAVIASPTVYDKTVEHGRTGLIARTPDEWGQALEQLVLDKQYRETLAANAHRYVLNHRMLVDHIGAWVDWYYDLWHRRDALTRALLERYPAAA